MILHGFFRSGASYRVRIALELKGYAYERVTYPLREGAQRASPYMKLNPQGLVPTLEIDGLILTQSLAICEYLEERRPSPPLLPSAPADRARVRAFAMAIACDIHPLQNLKILQRLKALNQDEVAWARQTIDEGLEACARLIENTPGPFCFGETPTLADICLVPMLVNARRFGVDLRWPRLLEAESSCSELAAFQAAAPENQPDAQ